MARAGRKRVLPSGIVDRTAKGKGYQVYVGVDPLTGKRRYKNFSDRDKAIDFQHDLEAKRMRGDRSVTAPSITFADYTPLAAVTAPVPGLRKQQTADRDEALWRKHVAPYFDHAKLRSVTPDDVRAWVRKVSETGLHPSTVRRCYNMVSLQFQRAQAAGYIVGTPCVLDGQLPRAVAKDRGIAAGVEVVDMFRDELPERYRASVGLCVWGGLRIGEVCGLCVRDFDPVTGHLDIANTMIWLDTNGGKPTLQEGETKTPGSAAPVALPADVAEALAAHIEKFTDGHPDSLIFTSLGTLRHPDRPSPINKRSFYKLWNRATHRANVKLRDAGLPELPSDWKPHSQRRTGLTWASDAGETINDVQGLARHRDKRTTLGYIQRSARPEPRVNQARPSARPSA